MSWPDGVFTAAGRCATNGAPCATDADCADDSCLGDVTDSYPVPFL